MVEVIARLVSIFLFVSGAAFVLGDEVANEPANFDPESAYEDICGNKLVKLNRISDFERVFQLAKESSDRKCPILIQDAILTLGLVVEESKRVEVCSREHTSRITNYHTNYMLPNSPFVLSLPESIRRFFVAYSISVNKFCKENISKFLVSDSKSLLKPEDWSYIEEHVGKDSQNIFTNLIDIVMDQILSRNVAVVTENRAQSDGEIVYMETPHWEEVKRVQSVCKRRFQPIYQKLIVPPITLTNLGYNFIGYSFESETSRLLRKWVRVVYVCESLADIVVVYNPEAKEVKTYTKTEAMILENKYGKKEVDSDGNPQIEYKQKEESKISDELVDDKNVDKVCQRIIEKAKKYARNANGKPTPPTQAIDFLRFLFNKPAYYAHQQIREADELDKKHDNAN